MGVDTERKEKSYEEFKLAVANALAAWQGVEIAIEYLFRILISCQDDNVASVAFHSVVHLNNKLKMIDELVQYRLQNTNLLGEWEILQKKINENMRRRNKLVHWIFIGREETLGSKNFDYHLKPQIMDTRIRMEDQSIPKQQIGTWFDSFGNLTALVFAFHDQVGQKLKIV